jgi:hypothetical protein
MTKLRRCIAAITIGAPIVPATPAVAFHGDGFDSIRMGQQVFAGDAQFAGGHLVDGPCSYDYVPYYYGYVPYGNYCWQQVWTPSGWQWIDACSGVYGFSN